MKKLLLIASIIGTLQLGAMENSDFFSKNEMAIRLWLEHSFDRSHRARRSIEDFLNNQKKGVSKPEEEVCMAALLHSLPGAIVSE